MVKDGCGTEGLETLSDVKEAVDISIDILNDLLSYEKLEAGIMVIEPIKGGSAAASGGLRDIFPPQRH
eukprot:gene17310-35721_t